MLAVKHPLPAFAAVVLLAGAALAETTAGVPKNSYYKDPLTASERSGIAEEESVTPNDGRASVPNRQDDGVIPDAVIDQAKDTPEATAPTYESLDSESEANVIIDQSKKNYKVTKKDLANCMKDWGPQTQMTKEEWAASCRTTLEYFPDGP